MAEISSAEEKFLAELRTSMEDLTGKQAPFKGMIYGDSGSGKTVAAMQLAQRITSPDKTILFLDSAQGWVSLKNHPSLLERTSSIKIKSVANFEQIAKGISLGLPVGCVVVDEHSSFSDADLAAVTRARAASDATKDPDMPTQPDFGTNTARIKKYTAPFIQLPDTHLILVAHVRRDKDNMNVERTSPAYMPKLGSYLRGLMHLVGYMTADEVNTEKGTDYKREVQVNPTKLIVSKTRVAGFHGVRVSVPELCEGVAEWLGGKRETVETDTVVPDPRNEPSQNVTETDEVQSELEID